MKASLRAFAQSWASSSWNAPREWITDAVMVVFFFVVGLEVKRELVHGSLTQRYKAALLLRLRLHVWGFYVFIKQMGLSDFGTRNRLLLLIILTKNEHVFNSRSEYVSAFRIRFHMLMFGVIAALEIQLSAIHLPPPRAF